MIQARLRFAVGGLIALAVIVPSGLAWACVAPVSLTTLSNQVQPGGTVKVVGREMAPGAPVQIRLDSINGPVLASTDGTQPGGMSARWDLDVPIPADIRPGPHVLYAVQNYRNMNSVIPRATIYVSTAPPPAPAPPPRPAAVETGSGPSAVSLILIGLAVAAAALLVVGGFSVLAGSNRGPKPQPEATKAP